MAASAHPIPDAALEGDIAILGRKGKGKTYTAKGIVERLLDLRRREDGLGLLEHGAIKALLESGLIEERDGRLRHLKEELA
jgi:hypothetical protein